MDISFPQDLIPAHKLSIGVTAVFKTSEEHGNDDNAILFTLSV